MKVTLPPDLSDQVEKQVASGRYPSTDDLIEQAVRSFLSEDRRALGRLEALRRISQAVDDAGLYEQVLISAPE